MRRFWSGSVAFPLGFGGKVGFDATDSPQISEFLVVYADLKRLLHQHDDLKHGQRIHAQILVHAQAVVAFGQDFTLLGLEVPVDHAHHDRFDLTDILVLTESQGCLIGTRRATLEKLLEIFLDGIGGICFHNQGFLRNLIVLSLNCPEDICTTN